MHYDYIKMCVIMQVQNEYLEQKMFIRTDVKACFHRMDL